MFPLLHDNRARKFRVNAINSQEAGAYETGGAGK